MSERDLLMIPGPINFDPGVLRAMAAPTAGHTSLSFIHLFGEALERLKAVLNAPHGTPFVIAGSGTLAMESAIANLVEPGDKVLVLSTGYFGERIVSMAERYGGAVTALRAAAGDVCSPDQVEAEIVRLKPKLVTVTHVDTSTGVAMDVREVAKRARAHGAMVIADGVCSIGGMEFQQEEWGIDVGLTASQKAIGVPPGLGLLVASPRAIETFRARKTPTVSFYSDWANWLPVMESYLARKASYFATPPVNLVYALDESLRQILAEGLEARTARHARLSAAFKAGVTALGLKQVPVRTEIAAPTMTAPYYPAGVDAKLIGRMLERNVTVAGGLHKDIRDKYFRVGHMGIVDHADIMATLGALEGALLASGYKVELGCGTAAAQRVLGA